MRIRQPYVEGTCFTTRAFLFGKSRFISAAEWSHLTLGFRLMRRAHNG